MKRFLHNLLHGDHRKLWLDDERPAPKGWFWVVSAEAAICHLKEHFVEEVSLDHDLGWGQGDGYDVMLYLEHVAATQGRVPLINIHTANPIARQRMEAAQDSIRRYIDVPPHFHVDRRYS